jgi:hypothetical protein
MVGVLSLVIILGLAMLFHLFFYKPITDIQDQIAQVREDVAKKQDELAKEERDGKNILRKNPRLAEWQKISLPTPVMKDNPELKRGLPPDEIKKRHLRSIGGEYEKYLYELLLTSGFVRDTIEVQPRAIENTGATGQGPGARNGPPYTRLAFSVKGQAPLDGVVKMLDSFHRANLLHQIKNITIQKPSQSLRQRPTAVGPPAPGGGPGRGANVPRELDVTFTAEAVQVNGAEPRAELFPSKDVHPRVLAEPGRRYSDLAYHNVFLGKAAADQRLSEDKTQVLSFIRLTTISFDGRRWKAYVYDQGKGGDEKMLTADSIVFREFTLYDRYNNPVLAGKVLRIDDTGVFFEADGKYYRLACGDYFYPALDSPLTKEEVQSLGLAKAGP